MQFPWWIVAIVIAWICAIVAAFAAGWFWFGVIMLCMTAAGLLLLLSLYAEGMSR